VRDGQLNQLQTQLKALTKEGESQRRQLEAIILELQQQLLVLCTCVLLQIILADKPLKIWSQTAP